MHTLSATKVRKEWSSVLDSVTREKPTFIKRTRDCMFLADIKILANMLSVYDFHAESLVEKDGSVSLSLDELGLAENGRDEAEAKNKMAAAILEYAKDYYGDFSYWARGSRTKHIPYVFKALILDDSQKIGDLIICRAGKS